MVKARKVIYQYGQLTKWSTIKNSHLALWTIESQNHHLKFPSTSWQGWDKMLLCWGIRGCTG